MDNITERLMTDFFVMKGLQAFMQNPDSYSLDRQEAAVEYLNCLNVGIIKNSYYHLIKDRTGETGILNYLRNGK